MVTQKRTIWKTPTARNKLKKIYAYSCKKWNKKTAENYLTAIDNTIKSVAAGTKNCHINADFSTRFPYCICNRHLLFFEYQADKLILVTIFHTAMNVRKRLEEEVATIQQELKQGDD